MSDEETRAYLIHLRIPFEKIKETVETLLPTGHDPAVADRIAERAAKIIFTVYVKDRTFLSGRKPSVIMAATIYLAVRMEKGVFISQEKIANALDTYVLTFKRRANQIESLLGLEITSLYQPKRYVCPVTGKSFNYLNQLQAHMYNKGIKHFSTLKTRMFNDDGILIDANMLKKLEQYL